MGVLSDLVVAEDGDAEKIAKTPVPSQAFGGIDIKGIDPVMFATLHSILTNRTFEELLPLYDPVFTVSDEGPWVFKIPLELVTRLSTLGASERQSVAERWASTEEFSRSGWETQPVAETLDAICDEASKAVSSHRTLFLWVCL